jgi:fibronectin type 3 domain-containing protein
VTRPAAPANVRARRSGHTVALAWNAVPGADTYRIYIASSGAGPFTVAGTWPTPAFTVGNLDPGTRYYVRVSASNTAGWSPVSTTLVVAPLARPAAPSNVRARRSDTTVALAWNAVPGAQTYNVYVASSGAGPFTVAGTWPTPGFTVGNLDEDTRYYFRVSAGNAAGWSPVSSTLVVPAPAPPAAPANLRARRWADNISLAWDAVSGTSSYLIFMATSATGPYTRLNAWPRAAYTVGGVSQTTRYYFRVFAVNAEGWSPMGTTLVVPAVPTDPTAIPARNPGAMPVGVIGDSVLAALNDLGPSWGNLSGQYDVVANTRICRRLVDVTCDGRGDPSALSILGGGTIRGDVLIISVNSEWAPAFGSAVDQIMAQARALGFRRVVWLTSGRPGSNSAQVNAILRQKAETNSSMQIADWVAYSAGHPEWFWADGVHLRSTAGKLAMANFLAAQVAAAASTL